mmetsp:Transcript_53415/g.153241  ORF Transcript_53415/g.153241 Transcript_53415/m.153241 type:complete len:222 (+) Transcript_53415:311-976(+)
MCSVIAIIHKLWSGLVREHEIGVKPKEEAHHDEDTHRRDPTNWQAHHLQETQLVLDGHVCDTHELEDAKGGHNRKYEDHHQATGMQVHQESVEVPLIVEAYASVEPRAVVIHLEYTPPANAAMVRAGRLRATALPAPPPGRRLPVACDARCRGGLSKGCIHNLPRRAWIDEHGHEIVVEQIHSQEAPQTSQRCYPGARHASSCQSRQGTSEVDQGLAEEHE